MHSIEPSTLPDRADPPVGVRRSRRTRKSPSTSPTRRSRRPNTRYGCQRPRRQQRWKHLNLDPPIDEAALAKNRPLRV